MKMIAPAEITKTLVRVGAPRYGGLSRMELVDGGPTSVPGGVQAGEVPFAIEGELASVLLAPQQRMRGAPAAELLEIVQPSAERVVPQCRHFGVCGGCQYQHMAGTAQRGLKARLLREMLQAAGVSVPKGAIALHASDPWGYRNRIRLRVEGGKLGYSRRGSHVFLEIAECPIASPLLWRAAEALVAMTEEQVASWPAGSAEIELTTTEAQDALQVALHLRATLETVDRSAPGVFRQMCDALKERVPELRGGGLLVQGPMEPLTSRRVQERQRVEVAKWGEPGLVFRVGGRKYPVSRNAFFQVNRFMTERMVGLVLGRRSGDLAMDLYAGAGLFSLPLTERFEHVIAVEIGEPAASDLATLLRSRGTAGGKTHRAERKTTLGFLRDWLREGARMGRNAVPDLVVMDPPRAGLGDEVVQELVRLRAREMVYVSCDPTTFARDAKALIESGYAVTELHSLDLFPQTFHMETIAVFRR